MSRAGLRGRNGASSTIGSILKARFCWLPHRCRHYTRYVERTETWIQIAYTNRGRRPARGGFGGSDGLIVRVAEKTLLKRWHTPTISAWEKYWSFRSGIGRAEP